MMIGISFRALAAGLLLALVAAAPLQATVMTIARNDGSVAFTASAYIYGFGTPGSANYVASDLASYDGLGSDVTIRLTMGTFIDYFRPTPGTTLLGMLTSSTNHLWSSTATGPFIAPAYFSSHLGGSASPWPQLNVPGDNRLYLGFWGTTDVTFGGCCTLTNDASVSWGRAFTMDLIAPVPLPAGLPLIATGLGLLALFRRGRRRNVAA